MGFRSVSYVFGMGPRLRRLLGEILILTDHRKAKKCRRKLSLSFQAQAWKWFNVTPAHTQLVKASDMSKPNIIGVGKETPPTIVGGT